MSFKLADVLTLTVLAVFTLLYGYSALQFDVPSDIHNPGPGYFPLLLAGGLLLLCLFSLVASFRRTKEPKLELPNGKLVVLTILVIAGFLVSWSYFGFFYLNLFIFQFILVAVYRRKHGVLELLKAAGLSAGVCLFVYLAFDLLLKIDL